MASSTSDTSAASLQHAAGPRLAVIVEVGGAGATDDDSHAKRPFLHLLRCAFWASDVSEVMRPLPVERLAGLPPFVLGVSVIRGTPTPVLDAAALLDQPSEHRVPPARFVVMRLGARRVALAVDAVLGVRPLDGDTLHALPPLLRNANERMVAALATMDAQLLTVLGAGYALPPEVWQALAVKEPA